MLTRVKMLKVKIKSLAEEARIIRLEEHRAKKDPTLRVELWAHRTKDVRREQRSALLAYAFIRKVPYKKVEPKSDSPPDWPRVAAMVKKFGVIVGLAYQEKAFVEWRCPVLSA